MSEQQSYPLRCLFCGDSGHTLLHCKNVLPNIVALTQERDALKARVAELEKDAARYRWLKLQPWNMWGPNVVSGPRSEHVGNLDAAIDAVIAASKEAS